MRVRMIEPDHFESATSGCPSRVYMALGIEHETIRIVGQIAYADRFDDVRPKSEEHTAALGGQRKLRVIRDVVQRRAGDPDGYKASTAMAMPIPPPMQSAATP